MRYLLLVVSIVLLSVAYFLGGSAPFGRLAMAYKLPSLGAQVFTDNGWKGAAYYRASDYEAAVEVYKKTGDIGAYNLGNSLVYAGKYAAALEAYDVAMAHNQDDAEARANFDLVAAYYAGTGLDPDSIILWGVKNKDGVAVKAEIARGNARAAGVGDGVTNKNPLVGIPELDSHGWTTVRKVFDDKFVVASPRWLATLEDVPGTYLAARIAQEYKRRGKIGSQQEEASTPW